MARNSFLLPLSLTALLSLSAAALPLPTAAAERLPVITHLWKSAEFRKAFTGSYGVDARIEPRIGGEEKAVLDAVADEMSGGDRAGALNLLKNSSLTSGSAALSFNLGNFQFEEGKTEEAIKAFESAIELYPNFRDAHRNLAIALIQEGKFDEAEEHLTRAIELGAQDGLTFGLLGYTHLNHERYQAALQAYRLAQMTMPKEIQWKLGEAQCLLALDAHKEAESLYQELLQIQPTQSGIWMNLADAWIRNGENVKAIANLEFLRRMKALTSSEVLLLGNLYLNEDLSTQALDAYLAATDGEAPVTADKALGALEYVCQFQLWDEGKTLAARIGETYSFEPPTDEAPASTEDPKTLAARLAKEKSRLQRARALIELEAGDPATGAKLVEDLVARDPMDGLALLLLARYEVKAGNREKALMLLEQAAKDPDAEADVLIYHGELLVQSGEYEDALKLLERAQALKPNGGLANYLASIREVTGVEER